jgi:hypothetical protein
MKTLKTLLAVALLSIASTQGAVQSESNLALNTNKTILAVPAVINSITLWSTNTAVTTVNLYDYFRVYTNTAYTNWTVTTTSEVTTWITSTGTTNSSTNTVTQRTANPVAAASNVEPPIVKSLIVPATGTANTAGQIVTYTGPFYFNRRVVADISATGLSYVMDYSTP